MSQRYYNQTLVSVTPTTDKTKIQKLTINAKKQSDSSNITDLVQADFTVSSATALVAGTDWTLNITDAANGNYAIEFATGSELSTTSYAISLISKGSNLSDRLFIDFAETFNANGQADFTYKINAPGSYKVMLDSADGVALSKASTATYTFNNPPTAANSSISIVTDSFAKPYLAQVLSGGSMDVSVSVTLKDSDDTALQGACEVSIFADMQ